MLVAHFFMDASKYKKSKDFDRNEAIYVLHIMDKFSHAEIAKNFNLAVEEIQKIITIHAQYEALIVGEVDQK